MSPPSLVMPAQAASALAPGAEAELKLAFASFERTAANMVRAYRELEVRAAHVDAQLDTTNGTLRGVLESMPSGLVTRDAQGSVTLVNRAACLILARPEEALRREFGALLDAHGALLAAPAGDGRETRERLYVRPDGATHVLLWTCTPTAEGGSLSLFSDVTELKRLQAQILARERFAALGETAATLTHQVRNPLHALRGFLSLLQRELDDEGVSAAARRYLDRVNAGADALERVVAGFLDLAREEQLELRPVPAGDLARSAVAATRGRPQPSRVTLEVACDQEVAVDVVHLEQALLNLLDNAREASSGAPIHVRVTSRPGGVAIAVEDQGPGIAPELLPRLFQAFVSTKARGNGLGLAYARKIATLHGGSLRAENRAQGGARFVLELPCAPATGRTRKVG